MTRRYDVYDDDDPPRGRGFLAGVASATLTLLALALAATLIGVFVYNMPGPKARQGAVTDVVLRKGAGVSEIGAALERAGAVRSAPLFMAAAQLGGSGRRLKAGEYEFSSGASLSQVIDKLRRGEIVHHHVTIPEGLTSQQAVDILNHTDVLTGSAPTPPEGALLPETYDVVRGEERSTVLQRMMDARDKLLAQLWAKWKAGLPFQTPDQAVNLASIVEKETALPAERPRVASVYVNRLRQGIRLEADPTLIYGINRGLPMGRGLLKSELVQPGPYNTYLTAGLPPTPIANPGRASLAAVLDPPDTKDLYFVADGTGGHAFAASYEEHLQNVANWRKIEHARAAAPPSGTGGLRPGRPAVRANPMAPLSGMTGFSRRDGALDAWTWSVEARSVNGRNLEARFRGPQGFDALERIARDAAQSRFQRGQITIGLQAKRVGGAGKARIDTAELDRLIGLSIPYVAFGQVAPPRFDGLLALPGVMETDDDTDDPDARKALEAAMAASIAEALDGLKAARDEEGAALASVLAGLVDRIEALRTDAEGLAAAQGPALKERYRLRIAELAGEGAANLEERIVQEAAMLAMKADVREELDRLAAHVAGARTLLSDGGPAGRRLDFLAQEFMREANTLCSKSASSALTGTGLDLKAAIEQFREQIQNVE